MANTLEIRISAGWNKVELLLLDELTIKRQANLFDELRGTLRDMVGVEEGDMSRYSIMLDVATHIIHPEDLADDVYEYLTNLNMKGFEYDALVVVREDGIDTDDDE